MHFMMVIMMWVGGLVKDEMCIRVRLIIMKLFNIEVVCISRAEHVEILRKYKHLKDGFLSNKMCKMCEIK